MKRENKYKFPAYKTPSHKDRIKTELKNESNVPLRCVDCVDSKIHTTSDITDCDGCKLPIMIKCGCEGGKIKPAYQFCDVRKKKK